MTQKRSLFDGVLYFVNILFAIGMVMAYLAYYIPPSTLSVFSYAATGFPVLFIGNALFIFYWAIRFKRKILLPIFVLTIGYLHLPRMYQFGKTHIERASNESLKVMSFNLRLFNLYDWIEGENVKEQIKDLIIDESPDVLLLQEYHESGADVIKALNYPYEFSRWKDGITRAGLIILSKHPIVSSKMIPIETDKGNKSSFIFADVLWNNNTIRFIDLHLASVGLEDADYDLLENPDVKNQENMKKGIKAIVRRLHYSYKRRGEQIKTVKAAIRESPYPVVLAGDFNDVPQSYVYHQIDQLLSDSYFNGGQGFGKTYIRSPLPLRIDYIFHDSELKTFNFKVLKEELSDHRPIVAELEYILP